MKSTYTTKEKRWLMQVEHKWCGKFSRHNFKQKLYTPATFGRKPHSLPYNIFCDFLHLLVSFGLTIFALYVVMSVEMEF
jgi:hypothetical protein